jgi:hypothetical protein
LESLKGNKHSEDTCIAGDNIKMDLKGKGEDSLKTDQRNMEQCEVESSGPG